MEKADGMQTMLKCEDCHAPGLKYALYAGNCKGGTVPDSLKLYKSIERKDRAKWHQVNAARIQIQFDTLDHRMIRQVDALKHKLLDKKTNQEFKCIDCHNHHRP